MSYIRRQLNTTPQIEKKNSIFSIIIISDTITIKMICDMTLKIWTILNPFLPKISIRGPLYGKATL